MIKTVDSKRVVISVTGKMSGESIAVEVHPFIGTEILVILHDWT
jgi:hypothetical protein